MKKNPAGVILCLRQGDIIPSRRSAILSGACLKIQFRNLHIKYALK